MLPETVVKNGEAALEARLIFDIIVWNETSNRDITEKTRAALYRKRRADHGARSAGSSQET
jgi:hypothetical protein